MTRYETLATSLRYQDKLKIECGHCGHKAEIGQRDAIELFGPDATPFDPPSAPLQAMPKGRPG